MPHVHRSTRFARPCIRGFTLTELMVAISVLLIVIVAVGKIFGTASQVTGIGQATADVLAEAAAFERRLREDISRLSTDGFFAIRNVAVPNDVNGSGKLLDPRRPDNAVIRADQLVFFTAGVTTTQVFASGEAYADRSQQALATRVYYGHGFQVPELGGCQDPRNISVLPNLYGWYEGPMVPWYEGPVDWISNLCGGVSFGTLQNHAQIPAAQWMLARQEVLIADDGGSYQRYLLSIGGSGENSVEWLHDDRIRNSRRDIAGRQLSDIRCNIQAANSSNPKRCDCADTRQQISGCNVIASWDAQRDYIERYHLFYPRVERFSPDMPREDVGLTVSAIAAACSSIEIEWTYRASSAMEDGIGYTINENSGISYHGALVPNARPQPWFGLRGDLMTDSNNEVGLEDLSLTFGGWQALRENEFSLNSQRRAILPDNIERFNLGSPQSSQPFVYTAVFGYNRTDALDADPSSSTFGEPVLEPRPGMGFTPWPSAIRVTLTLHDADNRLAAGRKFQFVVDLPRRVEN